MTAISTLKLAQAVIQRAQASESVRGRYFGGHRHTGVGNPLITEMPLPRGWRKP